MKFSININQAALSNTHLDLKDAAILEYLKSFCMVDDKKIKQLTISEEGIDFKYTWINYNHLINEMPLLGIKQKASISERIQKIEKAGFIKTFRAPDRSVYVRLLPKIKELEFADKIKEEKKGVNLNKQGCSSKLTGVLAKTNSTNNISYNNNINNNIATSNEVATLVNYFFELKGWANKAKEFYQKNKIIYSRYTKSAKYLLELCDGKVEEAKDCLKKVADWANSRNLDWSIETVFKKWYDLDFLKAKEKKPYVNGCRVFQKNNKWWLIDKDGEIKEYVGNKNEIIYQ